MLDVLLVAATDRELDGRDGLVCGIGPVEAAAATAAPSPCAPTAPCSTSASRAAVGRARNDRDRLRGGLLRPRGGDPGRRRGRQATSASSQPRDARSPDAPVLPIGTSAAVGSAPHDVHGRGDGRASASSAPAPSRASRRRGAGDLERDRRERPLALADRGGDRGALGREAAAAGRARSSAVAHALPARAPAARPRCRPRRARSRP